MFGEPWMIDEDRQLVDANGQSIISGWEWSLPAETAERILACVNACQGIPTELLGKLQLSVDPDPLMGELRLAASKMLGE